MADERRYYDPETGTFLPGARINIEQYEILKRCSDRGGDISEWQQYRENHPDEEIWLCGADLSHFVLKSPAYEEWRKGHEPQEMTMEQQWHLHKSGGIANFYAAHLEDANLIRANLDGADLFGAHLENARLLGTYLRGAGLWEAYLNDAHLREGRLQGALLGSAHLDRATLEEAHLDGADVWHAHLVDADLSQAHLSGADLQLAYLDGAYLTGDMRGTSLRMASVNGQTVLYGCRIDKHTDATGVPLDAARVEPGLKQLLEYNVRRIAWEKWYRRLPVTRWQAVLNQSQREEKRTPLGLIAARAVTEYFKRLVVQSFWWISDYGRVTWRIGLVFLFFAAYFGLAYCLRPSCLVVNGEVGALQGPWHALYFSIVTQTTLGFGDIHANPADWYGQLLLMLQVILGYVLLGALVTRFAVLFTAGGPAGRFSPRPKKPPTGGEGAG